MINHIASAVVAAIVAVTESAVAISNELWSGPVTESAAKPTVRERIPTRSRSAMSEHQSQSDESESEYHREIAGIAGWSESHSGHRQEQYCG